MPKREEILDYLAENPGRIGKREIARAFGIRGDDRIPFKLMLKDMANDGLIAGRSKAFTKSGDLPNVLVVEIRERDDDGDLIARPTKWEEDGDPPRILVQLKPNARVAPGLGDTALVRIVERTAGTQDEPPFTGVIIKKLDKRPESVLGIVRFGAHAQELPRLIPVDRKQQEIEIEELDGAKDGDLVAVKISKIGRYGLARARVLEKIGSMNSEKAVSQIAIHEQGIPHIFPTSVIEAAESAEPAGLDENREDWRDIPLITIDPATAKDHDDAVYAHADTDPKNEGGWVVIVAIADVSAYVKPASALDTEAQLRGNSVYFPDRVVPMLPERISNDLCSLREHEDRPALAVKITLKADGSKLRHSFHRVLMRSHAKLAYEVAQAAIDGDVTDVTEPLLEPVLKPLWAAYAARKIERKGREPLDLNVPERRLKLDDKGMVESVFVPPRLDAHKLIEEFMILANVAAAETLEGKKMPTVYRVHDTPALSKLEALREFLSTIDINLPKQGNLRPQHFNGILSRVKDGPYEELSNQIVLRSQSQAVYDPDNIGHFGLNLARYAHFTSPIRRYADLLVHRALVAACNLGDGGQPANTGDTLYRIAEEISNTERRAMKAERQTIDRLIAHFLADKVGAAFWGRITGVTKSGLFIMLDDTGADGFIPISHLGDDYFIFDETRHKVSGDRNGETFTMGDRVEVKLVEALPFAGALRFEMISEGTKGKATHGKGRRAPTKDKGKRRIPRRSGPARGSSQQSSHRKGR